MEPNVPLPVSSVIHALVGRPPNRRAIVAPAIMLLLLAVLPMACDSSKTPAAPKVSFQTLMVDAKEGTVSAIDQIASQVRGGSLPDADLTAAIDEALTARPSDGFSVRVAWGDVVDAALASGKLDEARKKRCAAEAVSVCWQGNSERLKDAGGASISPGITFMFQASVGPASTISFQADIDSAQIDGSPLQVNPKETAEPMARARNPAVLDTNITVELPSKVAGKTLVVHWRVKIKDAKSGAALAEDWDHTEKVEIPATGKGSFRGRSARTPAGGK